MSSDQTDFLEGVGGAVYCVFLPCCCVWYSAKERIKNEMLKTELIYVE